MPRLLGFFDIFEGFDKLPTEEIQKWPYSKAITQSITNFAANRIIYPQTVSLTKADLETDFFVLKEMVSKQPGKFYTPDSRKIIITDNLVKRFPPLKKLISTLVEVLSPLGLTTVMVKSEVRNSVVGSIINPANLPIEDEVEIKVNGKLYKVNLGQLYFLSTADRHVRIKVGSLDEILVAGGKLGVVVDLRRGS